MRVGPQWGRRGECGLEVVKDRGVGGEGKWGEAGNREGVRTCKNEVIIVSKHPEQYQSFVYLRDIFP